MGGFWQGANEEPTFVPLDEFISKKFLEAVDGDFNATDLILEGVSPDVG